MSGNIKLSVVVNTKNSAEFLSACLASVRTIADEIVIVDMASTDDTVAIAQSFGARVFQFPHPEITYVEPAREFLFARARGQWLLLLDADEIIGEDLAKKITKIINDTASSDVYFIARQNIIFSRALKATGWYPDYQARLWKNGQLTWPPEIHSVPEIHGTSAHLPATPELSIVHQNYQTIADFLARSNRYSDIQARRDAAENKKLTYTASEFLTCFWSEWLQRLFALEGWRDGNHGALLSLLQANHELVVLAKQWQNSDFKHHSTSAHELNKTWHELARQTNYWLADLNVKNSQGVKKIWWQIKRKLNS